MRLFIQPLNKFTFMRSGINLWFRQTGFVKPEMPGQVHSSSFRSLCSLHSGSLHITSLLFYYTD